MRKRTVFTVFLIATILWVLFMFTVITCIGAENKPVSQSTSYENKIRKQLYSACVASGKGTSYCYNLYY